MSACINVRNVTLELPLFLQSARSAGSLFATLWSAAFNPPRREFRTILDDITFSAQSGDRIGLLGRNGAGKSSLLRILTEAYRPTRGEIEIHGSRQALLNVSLGFNNEATVLENLYLRGTAMGLTSSQVRDVIRPVLEFAELTDKTHHRLKTLSSGQRLRLGFSIATAVQHDIMIMDEWIGAGDAAFLQKARDRMRDRVDGAKIVVIASHNSALLRDVCNKGIVLESGRLQFLGEIEPAIKAYESGLRAAVPAKAV